MRNLIGAALLLLALSGPGWAQSVVVRAGEHADFTRVVFNTPDRIDVALTYRQNGIDLLFDRAGLQFDTSTVFDVIPQTRLTAVGVGPDGGRDIPAEDGSLSLVTFSLACRCDIQTSWVGATAFVVDIRDESEVSAALFSTAGAGIEPQEGPAPKARPSLLPEPMAAVNTSLVDARPEVISSPETPDAAIDLSSGFEQPGVGSVAFLLADAQQRLQELRPDPVPEPTEYINRLLESQGAILQQIGRAATQGLLEPRDDILTERRGPENGPDPVAVEPVQTTIAPKQPKQDPPAGNITVNAQTSMDQAMSERLNITLGNGQTPGCLDPRRVDAAAWAEGESFIDEIGNLRSRLLGEFDEPSPPAIKNLAKFYIHFGFGAEAAQVLTMLPEGMEPDPVLTAMINIFEEDHDGPKSVLAGYMDCDPVVAVWSLLSYDAVPGNEPIDPDGIVRGIMTFPVHLRAHLGPIVGEKLRVAGYPRAADHIARALLRNDDTNTTAAAFLDTMNGETGPDPRPSEADLGSVVADNGQPSADALLKLIEARLAEDSPMSEDMALLAGAYATELRDLPMGQDMARAYVLSLAASGDFDQAFEEFGRLMTAAPAPLAGTLTELMTLLVQKADDPDFLTYTVGADTTTRFGIDDVTGNEIAARLMSLGFPDEAGTFVAPLAQGAAERTRKLIRAEIALLNNRPRQAELEILGERGDDVQDIIARARSMAGEHGAAQQIFAQINAAEDAERQAFLDGDWDTLQASSDPAIAAIAERQIAPTADDEVSEVLARNTAMIEDSQSMRAEIEALLSGVAVPDAPVATNP